MDELIVGKAVTNGDEGEGIGFGGDNGTRQRKEEWFLEGCG